MFYRPEIPNFLTDIFNNKNNSFNYTGAVNNHIKCLYSHENPQKTCFQLNRE